MACQDKRKVWVNVKGHERRVLKCVDPPRRRARRPRRPRRRARPLAATPPGSPPATPPRAATPPRPQRRRIHISPPRATPPRFTATPPPSPPRAATPPRRRRLYNPANPPMLTATPPRAATPSRRASFTGKSGKTYHFQRFRKPHKKIFSVEPTYDDQALSDIRPLREFKARPARKYAKTWPGYY